MNRKKNGDKTRTEMSKQRGSFVVYSQAGYWTGKTWSRDVTEAIAFRCADFFDASVRAHNLAVKLRPQAGATGVLYCPPDWPPPAPRKHR